MPRGAYDTTYLFTTPNHHHACPTAENLCALGPQHPDYQVCTDFHGLLSYEETSPTRSTNNPPPRPPPIPYQEDHLSEETHDGYFQEAYSQYRID